MNMATKVYFTDHQEMVAPSQRKTKPVGDLVLCGSDIHPEPIYLTMVGAWFFKNHKPRSWVPCRYLRIVLMPTQCLLVGAIPYLANKFIVNTISGLVQFHTLGPNTSSSSPLGLNESLSASMGVLRGWHLLILNFLSTLLV